VRQQLPRRPALLWVDDDHLAEHVLGAVVHERPRLVIEVIVACTRSRQARA
jgi:hypothetical protein